MPVRFLDEPDLAYVMTRYRESHDLIHAALNMPTNMLGEVTVKWIEALNIGLPMCWGAAVFGAARLRPKWVFVSFGFVLQQMQLTRLLTFDRSQAASELQVALPALGHQNRTNYEAAHVNLLGAAIRAECRWITEGTQHWIATSLVGKLYTFCGECSNWEVNTLYNSSLIGENRLSRGCTISDFMGSRKCFRRNTVKVELGFSCHLYCWKKRIYLTTRKAH